MKKRFILHPFLLAAFPIVFLVAYNIKIGENFSAIASFSVMLLSLAVSLGLTALILFVLSLFVKDYHRVGVIVSLFLIFFFSYGPVYELINHWPVSGLPIGRHRYLLPLWGAGIALGFMLLIKASRDFSRYTGVFNIVTSVLIATSLSQIGFSVYHSQETSRFLEKNDWIRNDVLLSTAREENGLLPDIYYIITDGHASGNTLREIFGYSNAEFEEFLRQRGFYIAAESHANYPFTVFSLASSLNMQYLNHLVDLLGKNSTDTSIPTEMRKTNNVVKMLKSIGYQYVYISSGRIDRQPDADVVLGGTGFLNDRFILALFEKTMLNPLLIKYLVRVDAKSILKIPSTISGVVDGIKGPKYVFVHLLLPHEPFIFNANGDIISSMGSLSWTNTGTKKDYLEQLIFTDRMLKQMIENILQKSKTPPIIIVQGDHGSQTTLVIDRQGTWNSNPTKEMLQERMGILNAYYLPSVKTDALYESISPVNTFRVIFNSYFGAKYELLDDRSYFFNKRPYDPIEVKFDSSAD